MTEHEYYKVCIGHKNKTLNKLRLHRQLVYFTATMNADQKKVPSITKFMPLEGDNIVEYVPPPIEKLKEWDKKFKSLFNRKK